MPRPAGSKNHRTRLSDRRLSELAQSYTEEALRSIVSIARGDVRASAAYPCVNPGPNSKPTDTAVVDEFERRVEDAVREEHFIPCNVRLAAWIELLNRGHGKPFQSVMDYDEKDTTITFKDADEAREKLIAQGFPPALLEPARLRLVDPDVVRREAEEESQQYLRRARREQR
jgi:hypothetical protein